VDPVSAFKFACPVCGQHLQARAEEAGQTTECPSCFKKLTVPQAPTDASTKLIITASVADARRGPHRPGPEAGPAESATRSSKRPAQLLIAAVVVAAAAVVGVLLLKPQRPQPVEPVPSDKSAAPASPGLWTNEMAGLKLLDTPVRGRLNGWDFALTTAFWRDTRLILRQNGGEPEGLRLTIDFPLKGGELVSGKTFRVGPTDPSLEAPLRIIWRNESRKDQELRFPSDYLLWVKFEEVSPQRVGGRIHVCLPDARQSWLAGRFLAENRTRPK